MAAYQFPEKNKFAVTTLLSPNFDIEPFWDALHVDLNAVRGTTQHQEIRYALGLTDDELPAPTQEPVKIIYSGHLGCGKTTELREFHRKINQPAAYFSVFIDFEKSTQRLMQFEPEDFFVLLISNLIAHLETTGVAFDRSKFDAIACAWLDGSEVREELWNAYDFEQSGNFWEHFTSKSKISDLLASGNRSVRTIRRVIREKADNLMNLLNKAFDDVRAAVLKAGRGRDLLFIVDNSEKMERDKYFDLFIKNAFLLRGLAVKMICTVPIDTLYDIYYSRQRNYYKQEVLPMIRVGPASIPALKQLITKRIDEITFFESGVLERLVEWSGGCPRQLFRLVEQAIIKTLGERVNMAAADAAAARLGQELWEVLTKKHIEVLRSGTYQTGEKEETDMLYGLQLLKYNGDIVPNPLLAPYLHR